MKKELVDELIKAADRLLLQMDFGTLHSINDAQSKLQKAVKACKMKAEPVEEWVDMEPPTRGVYRVKRIGEKSISYGWAYWDKERWGGICGSRGIALEYKTSGRKTPSRYPMQWLKKSVMHYDTEETTQGQLKEEPK